MESSLAAYPYLLGSLAIAAAAAASVALQHASLRHSAALAALLAAPFTLVSLDYASYWHPSRLGGLPLGLEDLLLSVSSGVFLWTLPAMLSSRRLEISIQWKIVLRRYLLITLAGAGLVGICRFFGLSASFSLATAMAAISLGILTHSAAYWRLALAGCLSFLGLYLTILNCVWAAFPSFISEWNWAGLCGITLMGIPLEEVCWAAGYGAVWPLMMACVLQARIQQPG